MKIFIVELGEWTARAVETEHGLGEVHIVTEDGTTYRISEERDSGNLGIRTRDGSLEIMPEAANKIVLRQRPH